MPDSVLATAHSLRTLVADSFPLAPTATATATPAPHPLGASPAPASLPALRAALSSHLSSLRSSLATFSALALAPSASLQEPTVAATGKRETDKYLTLLRDSAQHQAALLSHRTAAAHHRDADDDAWPVRVPRTRSRGAVLEALEGIAKELALVAFRDDDGGEGGAEGIAAEESTKPVTLSVGGKVMVVDFEVRGPADAGEGARGATVERVKVAYVVDGTDRVCDRAAQRLHALLSGPCDNERDEQERWKGVRRVLRQLGELDAETERSGRDCFTLLTESLVEELGEALGGAQPAAGAEEGQGSTALPALLPPSPTSLYPTLHLYSTPLASLLSPSSSSSPASTKTPGVYTATISLDLSASLGTGAGEEEAEPAPRFVAVLDPPVPLSRATGREICEALGLRGSRDSVRDEEEGEDGGEEADEGWWSAVCGHERARGGRAEGDYGGSSGDGDEKCYRITYPSLRPLSLHPVLPSPAAGTVARPAPLVATHLRFSRAAQLVAALGVLRRQVRVNEVVWSLLRERERGREWERGESEGGDAEGKGRRREKKRRKVEAVEREDEGKTMTLDELFATPTAPSALPITLHPSPSRGSSDSGGGGGVLLSLPFPPLSSPTTQHLLGLPLSLSLSLSPAAAYRAQLALPPGVVTHLGGGAERVEALERRVERVLEATGEAGLAVREVLRALEGAEGAVGL